MDSNRSGAATPSQDPTSPIESKCPVPHGGRRARTNADWWPNRLDLKILHQNSPLTDPMPRDFDYGKSSRAWI